MSRVVEADGVHVTWVDRRQQGAVVQRQGGVGEFDVAAKDVAVDEGGNVVDGVDGSIVELLVVVDSGDIHGAFLSFMRSFFEMAVVC